MTVTTTLDRQDFPGDGSNKNFPFNFKFFDNSQIYVYLIDPSGLVVGKTLNVDYTLSGALSAVGGQVIMSVAPPINYRLLIQRKLPLTQPTSIRNQGAFFPAIHEDVFDRLTMLIQQALSGLSRALQIDKSGLSWDFLGLRGSNIADPVGNGDVVNRGWVTQFISSVSGAINTTNGIAYDTGTLFDYLRFGLARNVDTIAALRLLVGTRNQRAQVLGYYAKGDGGGGIYYLDQADTTTADDGGSVIVGADGSRWKMFRSKDVSVLQFGARGDAGVSGGGSAHDDAPAFVAANNYLLAAGGGTLRYSKRHLIATAFTLGRNVCLKGPTGRADPGNPFANLTAYWAALQKVPALIIDPAIKITRSSNSGLSAVYALRKGLALDGTDLAANFSGTAFGSLQVDGTFVESCTVIGFNQAFYDQQASRMKFEDVLIDCNAGIYNGDAADISRYRDVHCYGVTQAGVTGHQAISNRSGSAFFFGGAANGGPMLDGCFAYSFQTGFNLGTPGSYTLTDCWVDGTTDSVTGRPLVSSRVGLLLSSAVAANAEPQIVNFKACCQGTAITLEAGNFGTIQIVNAVLWQNNDGINCSAQNLNILNFACRGYSSFGIVFNSVAAASSAKIANATFYGRVGSAVEINCAAGLPLMNAVTYLGGQASIVNESRGFLAPVANVLTIPDGKEFTFVNGTGVINSILPAYDGAKVELQFTTGGSTFLVSAFRLSAAFTAAPGSSITLRYSRGDAKWFEVSRAI